MAFAVLHLSAPAVSCQPNSLREIFGIPVAIGQDAEFAQPLSLSVFADGSVLVLDLGRFDVSRVSPDGHVRWRAGRKGSGPGEFQLATRAVVRRDQSVLVFDLARPGAAHFSPDGKYLGEVTPDLRSTIDQIAVLPSGHIAITGFTRDPRGRDAAIHVFTSNMQHVRSFGPLTDANDPRVVADYGAGGITVERDGTLLHTRIYPYEIRRFTVDGRQLSLIRVDGELSRPDEYIRVSKDGGRMTASINSSALRALPARRLPDGSYLGGRTSGKLLQLEQFNERGEIVATMRRPAEWGTMPVVDVERNTFWLYGTQEDVPVLWKIPFGTAIRR